MTRKTDTNGWFEVKRNPLSRVGVFPYSGRSLGLQGMDGDRIVRVLRPPEELSDPECLDSFKLVPWVDDHTMLGTGDDVTPAEVKGVQGVIGEEVFYEDGIVYGNIKAFSNSLARLIEAGKKQLSAGYRCVYDWTAGVWNGQPYDCVQRQIRGNHLALVSEGRMGPSVAVMDRLTFTFDAQEAVHMPDPTNSSAPPGGGGTHNDPNAGGVDPNNPAARLTIAEIASIMQAVVPMLSNLQGMLGKLGGTLGAGGGAAPAGSSGNGDPANPHPNLNPKPAPNADDGNQNPNPKDPEDDFAMDAALKAQVEGLQKTVDGLAKTVGDAAAAMDAALKAAPTVATLGAEAAQRDRLADRLGAVVGTFDAADKTLAQVAAYGVEKLGLKNVPAGSELVAVDAYLTAREAAGPVATVRAGMDAAPQPGASNFVTRHLTGAAK